MKYVLTLIITMTKTYDISVSQSKCQCSEISYEKDCLLLNSTCSWNGTNCVTWDCTLDQQQDQCALANTCAWKNSSCETFTQCSDYNTTDAPCNTQGAGCDEQQDESTDQSTDQSTNQSTNESTTNVKYCVDKKINITTIGKCTTYRNNETCIGTGKGCIWTGRVCKILVCQDFKTSDTCKRVYSENYQTVEICEWTSYDQCTTASSLDVLNETNCISFTSRRATWNSKENQCKLCSSFSMIITLSSILLL